MKKKKLKTSLELHGLKALKAAIEKKLPLTPEEVFGPNTIKKTVAKCGKIILASQAKKQAYQHPPLQLGVSFGIPKVYLQMPPEHGSIHLSGMLSPFRPELDLADVEEVTEYPEPPLGVIDV